MYPEAMADRWNPELMANVRTAAQEAGFSVAGVAATPPASSSQGAQTATRFTDWIDQGRAGEMEYLKRRSEAGELLRTSARTAIPWARSIVVCAFNYGSAAPGSLDPAPSDTGWIARYAQSGDADGRPVDYHDDMLRRLRQVESALQQQAPCESRCYVDTGPLLERDFAARAGVGWVGKNTCVIHQQLGSWLLLGVIVTSLPVSVDAEAVLAPDRCGSCTRCIDACPTDALIAPRQMDASLCIAYLTIEKKGTIPEELRPHMGRQVFGCDICQDVCPWNGRTARPPPPTQGLHPSPRPHQPIPLLACRQMDQAEFPPWFKGSPLERTKRHRLHRNVAIAMGNSGGPLPSSPNLNSGPTPEDPSPRRIRRSGPSPASPRWYPSRRSPKPAPEPTQTMAFLSINSEA